MKNKELIKNVIMAFNKLSESCEHAKNANDFVDGDCHHPDLDFNCMYCSCCNCPLLLGYEIKEKVIT